MEIFEKNASAEREKRDETLGEYLKERILPQLKKMRTYALAALMGLYVEKGVTTELSYHPKDTVEFLSEFYLNPSIEAAEDLTDELHRLGVEIDKPQEGSRELTLSENSSLKELATGILREETGAPAEAKPSFFGDKWTFEKARHLARINNIRDINEVLLPGKKLIVDSYDEWIANSLRPELGPEDIQKMEDPVFRDKIKKSFAGTFFEITPNNNAQ